MRVMSTCLSTLYGARLSRSDRKAFGYHPPTPDTAPAASSAFPRSLRYAETPCGQAGFAEEGLSVVTATFGFMEGTNFAEDRAAVVAGAVTLRRLLGRLHQAGSAELGPLFAELDQLKTLAEAAQVGVLDQALTRGDVKASDAASSAGWVRQWGHLL